MDEGIQGIIILSIITIISGISWHSFVKNILFAVIGATITTAITFQIANYLYIGYLDPFFMIAMFTTGAIAFIASLIIGIPFAVIRKRKNNKFKGITT